MRWKSVTACIGGVLVALGSTVLLCSFGGQLNVPLYRGESPKGTYTVAIVTDAGPSAHMSSWRLEVSRDGVAESARHPLVPFYAWTCVEHGRVSWVSDSTLHCRSYGAGQGRVLSVEVRNATDATIPYAEVRTRTVAPDGYSHMPGIFVLLDLAPGSKRLLNPMVFAGGSHIAIGCERDGHPATESLFAVPTPTSNRAPYLPFRNHRVIIELTDAAPEVHAEGGLEPVSLQEARKRVPVEIVLPLNDRTAPPRP